MNLKHIFLVIGLCLFAGVANAQTAKKWTYPVGTEEWSMLEKRKDRIKACQIPQRVISSLSTEDLTELCLQYPYISNALSFTSIKAGVDKLFNDFNGIRELFKREDVAKELLKQYQTKLQKLATIEGRNKKEGILATVSVLEALLTRYHTENSDAKEKYREILRNLVAGHEIKNMHSNDLFIKNLGFRTSYFSRAVLITKLSEQNIEELPRVEMLTGMASDESIRLIDEMSYQLIKK